MIELQPIINNDISFDGKNLYTWDAKGHYDSKFYRQAVTEIATAFSKVGGKGTIRPHQLRKEHLNRYGIPMSRTQSCMEAISWFIIEFYGIAVYELRNEEAIKFYGITDEELEIIMEFYPVDNAIHEYFKKKYGEDDNRRIKGRITNNERQNIVQSNLVDNTLSWLINNETQAKLSGATI